MVALGLLAYALGGEGASMVLGMVFTIRMVAYVGIAPIAGDFVDGVNRRARLVTLDVIRAGAALCLPFVTEVWQIYVLIFLLQSASAGAAAALRLWPKEDPKVLEHTHDNLPLDHPHLKRHRRHAHRFVVDDNHPRWALHL